MGDANGGRVSGPRCIAIVGPFGSGKTSLLEAILARTGAIERQGSVPDGSSVGDSSPEAREQGMSVSLNVATAPFMGDDYTFLDCPGSIEFLHDMRAALAGCDAALIVCEADAKKVPALQLIMKEVEDRGIPRVLFVNKVDKSEEGLRDVLELLQPASQAPLLMRQLPMMNGGTVSGVIDLALERAFIYKPHAPAEVVEMPDDERAREAEARFSMLEKLADYDDVLMEQLLEDVEPPRDRVFDDLRSEMREGKIVPVLFGSAEGGNGILRLLKALRHESPGIEATLTRLGVSRDSTPLVHVLKTLHTTHGGKLSLARVLNGDVADGVVLTGPSGTSDRVAGVFRLRGEDTVKIDRASAGDTAALGRLENAGTGETLSGGKSAPKQIGKAPSPEPVMAITLVVKDRKDEVKLTSAIAKLTDEDPSLLLELAPELHEIRLCGQGEMHLRSALARLRGRYSLAVEPGRPRVGYRETIRKSVTQRGRHKKQSGGHGQFGDVVVDVHPMPRGTGFVFEEKITGGVVPRQYIPSVEAGARDALEKGPLGFPVVDVGVTLTDGSYHSVDSSDMAFRTAGRIALNEGLAQCSPVLLEPILAVEIAIPSEATPRINGIVSSRRGQILGFDSRPGWAGWDIVSAHIPEAEIKDLIVEIRSATAGVGTFRSEFNRMQELTGKLAEQVSAAAA